MIVVHICVCVSASYSSVGSSADMKRHMDEGSMGSPMSNSGAEHEPDIKRARIDEQYETE